jgi:hypothetical protein
MTMYMILYIFYVFLLPIQDHALEGVPRRQSRLQERMCKLDSMVTHNGVRNMFLDA